jgi:hypothetical protein
MQVATHIVSRGEKTYNSRGGVGVPRSPLVKLGGRRSSKLCPVEAAEEPLGEVPREAARERPGEGPPGWTGVIGRPPREAKEDAIPYMFPRC